MSAEPTRRLLLALAAGTPLALAGCKGITALGPPPALSANVVTLDQAISAEERMVAGYQAAQVALAAHPGPAATITALLSEHQAHLAQLRASLVLPRRLATASPSPAGSRFLIPSGGPAQIVAALQAAEAAAVTRLTDLLTSVPPALAQLMASISASEAAHVIVLSQTALS